MYTLRYPIRLAQPYEIGPSEIPYLDFEGLSITLLRDGGYHVLVVSGLDSAESAVCFASRLWVALCWALLDRSTAFRVDAEPKIVKRYDNPVKVGENLAASFGLEGPVDALIDTSVPTVYPTNARLGKVTAGALGVTVTMPFDRFAPDLKDGLSVATSNPLPGRLRTALDLFHAHHFELSSSAQFFTLVMAMEVLAEPREKHPVAMGIIEAWGQEVRARREGEADPEVELALESLERELLCSSSVVRTHCEAESDA